ncbi:MAG: IS1 family transposase [Bacteroidia bacterium]|nr:IS1 family transposase [Bacteroidia bacterium]
MNCKNCKSTCIKKGFNGKTQKYFCKTCKVYQQHSYTYHICTKQDIDSISKLTCIGVGISGIAKYTGISKSNVINIIKKIAATISLQIPNESSQVYEMDEMHTFIKSKPNSNYLIYAINKTKNQVVDFVVGARTKCNIKKITDSLIRLNPQKIFTDKLNIYPSLLSKNIHKASVYKINHIERFNLTLRTHLKRLSRKTICFSKSILMLECIIKIYLHRLNTNH